MRNPHNDPLVDQQTAGSPRGEDPERRCILSGEVAARDTLIRLAISPEGLAGDAPSLVLPDVHARAPGRGAWIGVDREALTLAIAKGKLKGALARAFKGAALAIPDDLPQRIEAALQRGLLERLGLELRSGRMLMGSEKIAQAARGGGVWWLGHASDASTDGSRKLDQAMRVGREAEGSGWCGITLPLDRATLSVALGRENVVHLALTEPKAAKRVASFARRLLHFTKGQDGPDGTAPLPVIQIDVMKDSEFP